MRAVDEVLHHRACGAVQRYRGDCLLRRRVDRAWIGFLIAYQSEQGSKSIWHRRRHVVAVYRTRRDGHLSDFDRKPRSEAGLMLSVVAKYRMAPSAPMAVASNKVFMWDLFRYRPLSGTVAANYVVLRTTWVIATTMNSRNAIRLQPALPP